MSTCRLPPALSAAVHQLGDWGLGLGGRRCACCVHADTRQPVAQQFWCCGPGGAAPADPVWRSAGQQGRSWREILQCSSCHHRHIFGVLGRSGRYPPRCPVECSSADVPVQPLDSSTQRQAECLQACAVRAPPTAPPEPHPHSCLATPVQARVPPGEHSSNAPAAPPAMRSRRYYATHQAPRWAPLVSPAAQWSRWQQDRMPAARRHPL